MPRIGVSDFLASAGLADHPDHSLSAPICPSYSGSHSQLPAAPGPFAAAASPIFTASTFVQPKSSAPVVHSSFTSSHHEMEVDHSKRSLSTRKPPPPAKKLAHQGTAMAKPASSTDFTGVGASLSKAASGVTSSATDTVGSATGSSGGGSGGHTTHNCQWWKTHADAQGHTGTQQCTNDGKMYDSSKNDVLQPNKDKCCKDKPA